MIVIIIISIVSLSMMIIFHRHHHFVHQSSESGPRNSRTMINVDVDKNYKKVEEENIFREKLLAMKRYSGFLKRPEILETVYR